MRCFVAIDLPSILARRANPLLRDVLANYRFYWATHQEVPRR